MVTKDTTTVIKLVAATATGVAAAWAVETWRKMRSKRRVSGRDAQCCVVLGAQWGDEGKGKIVDVLAGEVDVVARFNGGANAGHTLEVDGKTFAFHLLPCGILRESCANVIGNGVVCHLPTLFQELEQLGDANVLKRLVISDRAHIVLDSHKDIDGMLEVEKQAKNGALGTTKRGIGPCYASKANRNGLRFCDLKDGSFREKFRALRDFQQRHYPSDSYEDEVRALEHYATLLLGAGCIRDTVALVGAALKGGKRILAEGANAALLDVDFGTYPYVTSSSTTAGGVCTGLGVPPSKINCVIGVVKAYTTRVGAGPFPTELSLEQGPGKHLSDVGREYGTTTGRKRRCGWLDAALLRYSDAANGYDSVCLTKLDVLTGLPTLKIATRYYDDNHDDVPFPASLVELAAVNVEYIELDGWTEDLSSCASFADLPSNAQRYVRAIEHHSGLTVSWVGVGPGRHNIFSMPGIL